MTKYRVAVKAEVKVEAESEEEAERLAEDQGSWEDTYYIQSDGVINVETEAEEA